MIKKFIFSTILSLSVALSSSGCEKMDGSKLEKMRKIKKGTSYSEIVSAFGQPDEELGNGLLIVGYVFVESKMVLHFFTGESLQGLWEIKNNGEKTVYIPLEQDLSQTEF